MTRSLFPVAGALALLALAGCSKAPTEVQPAEGPMGDRIAALEQEVRSLKDERDAAQRAGNAAGLQAQSLGQMLASMSERIKAMEEGARTSGGTSPAMGGEGSPTSSGGSTPAGTTPVVLSPVQPDGTFSEEQVTAFRKLEDQVQKVKRTEEQARRLKQFLTTAGITLQASEQEALLRLQASYGEKMQDLLREGLGMGTTDAERQERRDKIETLRKQYETDIRAQVSSTDADTIVEAMLRTGSFPRRTDGRAGMNGATPGR
jgi:hypothetical protein